MNRFQYRRLRNATLTLIAIAAFWAWVHSRAQALRDTSFVTGYVLISAVVFLALYNARKKLPFLSLGTSAAWLQWHIYVGLGSMGLFAMHAGLRWPTGVVDSFLAGLYWLTVASGLFGLYLSRTIPPQLARIGRQVVYERIPALRDELWRRADIVVMSSVAASGATTLADFYASRLFDFFARPRRWAYVLRPTSRRRKGLLGEMSDLRRYLSDQEQGACETLFELVRTKDDLDFHEARQKLLKTWLFVHIALSYALVVVAGFHAILALAFRGGGP